MSTLQNVHDSLLNGLIDIINNSRGVFGSPFPTNAPAVQVLKRGADRFDFSTSTKQRLHVLADKWCDVRKRFPDWNIPEQEEKALFQDYYLPVFEDLYKWSGEAGVKFEVPMINIEQTRTDGKVVYQTRTTSSNRAGVAAQSGKSENSDGTALATCF